MSDPLAGLHRAAPQHALWLDADEDDLLLPPAHAPAALLLQFAQAPARMRFDLMAALNLTPLGDGRRNERELELLTAMIQGHSAHRQGTNAASDGQPWAHAMGAYRFYGNQAVGLPLLYQGCHAALRQLAPVGQRVYIAHDLSTVDYSSHNAKKDRVPVGDGRGRGYELYCALVLDSSGRPLGPAVQELRTAVGVLSSLVPSETPLAMAQIPTYDVTSDYAQIERAISALCTILPDRERVHILDAHFDELQFERFVAEMNEAFVLRAFQWQRVVRLSNGLESTLGKASKELSLQLRGEVERDGKRYEMWAGERKVTFEGKSLRGVKKGKAKPKEGKPVEMRVVVTELRRAGKTEHRWVLLTKMTDPLEQIVQIYLWRWRIERLFFFTKVGLRLEQWQQQCGEKIARRLAVASLAAMVLYQVEGATEPEMVELRRWLATRGGWLGRKKDAIGPLVLMRGLAQCIGALSLLEQLGAEGVRAMGAQLSRLMGMPLPGISWNPAV